MSYRPHPTKAGAWYIDIGRGKDRQRIPFVGTEAECIAVHDEVRRQYKPEIAVNSFPTISEIWPLFLASHTLNIADNTLIAYGWAWKNLQPHFGKLRYTSLTRLLFESYMAGRINSGVTKSTVTKELAYFSQFLKFSAERGYCNPLPFKIPSFPAKATAPPPLEVMFPEDVRLFLSHTPAEYIDCIKLMVNCGLRRNEALYLTKTNLRKDHIVITGKGNKTRVVSVDQFAPGLMAALHERAKKHKATLFPEMPIDMRKLLLRIARNAGLDIRVHPHLLRHSAATAMIISDMSLVTIQVTLGHSDIKTTMKYIHIANCYVKDEAGKVAAMYEGMQRKPANKERLTRRVNSKYSARLVNKRLTDKPI